MSAPTIHRLLMQEALDDARRPDEWSGMGGIDRLLGLVAADEHCQERARSEIRAMLRSAYMSGVQHGYVQAAERFDERAASPSGDAA